MEELVEQRVCLKFCVSNEISCAESLKMLQKTYGKSCMSKTQAYKAFKKGREVVVDFLRFFFDYRGVVHSEFLPEGQTVNKKYYLGVSTRMSAENGQICGRTIHGFCIMTMHRRTKPSLRKSFWQKNTINVIDQAPHLFDMSPCDFFLFPKLKLSLRGRRFESIDAIKENSQKVLKFIP